MMAGGEMMDRIMKIDDCMNKIYQSAAVVLLLSLIHI